MCWKPPHVYKQKGNHRTLTNTNNVNKTLALLQKAGGKYRQIFSVSHLALCLYFFPRPCPFRTICLYYMSLPPPPSVALEQGMLGRRKRLFVWVWDPWRNSSFVECSLLPITIKWRGHENTNWLHKTLKQCSLTLAREIIFIAFFFSEFFSCISSIGLKDKSKPICWHYEAVLMVKKLFRSVHIASCLRYLLFMII